MNRELLSSLFVKREKLPEGGVYGRRLLPCCAQDWL